MSMRWNVGYIPRKRAEITPEETAIIFEDAPVTYRDLNTGTNRCAHLLQARGVGHGDRVAAVLLNSVEFLEVYFACAKLGAIFVPLNWRLVGPELRYALNDSGARAVVFHDAFADTIGSIRGDVAVTADGFICIATAGPDVPDWAGDYHALMRDQPAAEPVPDRPIDFADPLAIMYTSGTTGDPKGAVLSHEQTYFKNAQMMAYQGLRAGDVMLAQLPLFHSGGLFIVATPSLHAGVTMIMRAGFDPAQFAEDIERYRATVVFALTTMWSFILQTGKLAEIDASSVRSVIGGGERTPASLIDALAERGLYMQQGFGQTECSAMFVLPQDDIRRKMGSVGKPGFFTDAWVADADGARLPPGEIGEVVAQGPTVMSGYWNRPEVTAQTIVDGVLHTGDLGYVDEEGYFYIVDRAKDMYRSGGENVYPAEVEKILAGHPAVALVAIVGVPDERWGETGMAFVVPEAGHGVTEDELREFLQGKVAKFKHPTRFKFLDELPLTATMKVRKVDLREQYATA